MKTRIALAIFIATSLVGNPGAAVQDQRPVFKSRTEGVRVDVSVRDRTRPVKDLTAADFELTDDGVPQEVVDVIYERAPIDVTVGLDISFSVDGVLLDQLRQAVIAVQADLRDQDRLKLTSFNMRVLRQLGFLNDRRTLVTALAGLGGMGSTSLFDAIAVELVASASPERRHLAMLFTDGEDTSSITHPSTLIEVAQRTNVALGFVLAGRSPITRPRPPLAVTRLVTETGGQVVPMLLGESPSSTFRRMLEEFRASYVLLFRPTGADRPGFHELQVRVKGQKKYEVRARRGYYR